MKTTIVIGRDSKNGKPGDIPIRRDVFFAKSKSEAYLYHIENSRIDSYIIYPGDFSDQDLESMIAHIHYLNEIITIIIYKPEIENTKLFEDKKNVKLVGREEDISGILKTLPEIHRDNSRVRWPLAVNYWETAKPKEKYHAIVLSISSSGCFMQVKEKNDLEIDDMLSMTFSFKDFDFYSEGSIVRLKITENQIIDGVGVKFSHTSPQTKKCIQEIINEKILVELMETLELEHRE